MLVFKRGEDKSMKKILIIVVAIGSLMLGNQVFAQTYPEGMISYWKFDEGNGTIANDYVGNNHGILIDGPQWTTGKVGGAINFDGIDDYINCGTNFGLISASQKLTVELWLNTQEIRQRKQIVSQTPYLQGPWSLGIPSFDEGTGVLALFIRDANPYRYTGSIVINDGNWHHVVGTWDGATNTIALYIDGNLDDAWTTSYFVMRSTETELGIGSNPPQGGKRYFFNGTVDEVAIYNRALTPEEIQQHYQNGLNGLGYEIVVSEISCTGFEPPMDKIISVKKKNRVLPLKMVCYDGATELTDLDIAPPVVEVNYVDSNGIPGAVEEVLYAGQCDEGNQFAYSDGYWRFNLQTKNFSAYGTYSINAVSGDTSSYNIEIPNPEATFVIE